MSAVPKTPKISCVEVALDVPMRQCFTYLFKHKVPQVGSRVTVPFGHRRLTGVVVSHCVNKPAHIKLKSVHQVLDDTSLFSARLIKLISWTARYYHHPLGEVWRTAMPVILRKGRSSLHGLQEVEYQWFNPPQDWSSQLKRAPVQRQVMQAIYQQGQTMTHKQLMQMLPNGRSAARALIEKKWLKQTQKTITPKSLSAFTKANTLTEDQQKARDIIAHNFAGFQCTLLQGVTGSGKTEVYFSLIDKALAQQQQALVLLPEIALTDQHFTRFKERFGSRVGQIHSGMDEAARYRVWWQTHQGDIQIVLGTRSSVFMDFKALGLIIMDEEHDLSYKQHEGLRYHARSVAIKRAQIEGIPIVLGSATPALETLYNVSEGRYQVVKLESRVGSRELPHIDLVDLNIQRPESGLSQVTTQALAETLKQKKQALVYINRRGYAPVLYCPSCQWTAQCRRCDAQMTSHQQQGCLQCHHCGAKRRLPKHCDHCHESSLIALGEGTQKIQETLQSLFPQACIQRFDRDELNSAKKLKSAMDRVHAQEVDILVGTQLLSKGHDFSAVNLVVVINADQGLYSIDFRAPEQLVQQLIQVAGRSGRGTEKGQVIIQTNLPAHPALLATKTHQYPRFAQQELAQRALAQYPPYSHIALWRARSTSAEAVMQILKNIRDIGLQCQPQQTQQAQTMCYDPVKSTMFKRSGQFHAQLLISATQRHALHQWLDSWITILEQTKLPPRVKWSIDIDPISLI